MTRTNFNIHGSGFIEAAKAVNFSDVIPDLKSIIRNSRPKTDCPKWYMDAIEQADFAYETNTGWKLTSKGASIVVNNGRA